MMTVTEADTAIMKLLIQTEVQDTKNTDKILTEQQFGRPDGAGRKT